MLKGSPILPLGCWGHQVYIEDILLFRMVENTNVKLHLICPEELSNAAELRSPAFFFWGKNKSWEKDKGVHYESRCPVRGMWKNYQRITPIIWAGESLWDWSIDVANLLSRYCWTVYLQHEAPTVPCNLDHHYLSIVAFYFTTT